MTDNDGNANFSTTRDRSGFGSNWRPVTTPPQPPAVEPKPGLHGTRGYLNGEGAPPSDAASWTIPGAVPPAQSRGVAK